MNTFIFLINKRYFGTLQATDGAMAHAVILEHCRINSIIPVIIELKGVASKTFTICDSVSK